MSAPRLRVFAGPNGSGKSTLFDSFSRNYNTGLFINADYIEKELSTKGYIDLNEYDLELTESDLQKFLRSPNSQSLIQKSLENQHKVHFEISQNMIVDKAKDTHSYEGALISSLLREKLQEKQLDYSFETVMSHISKIDDIKAARKNGYKTYLYFICIDDPEVNISRVQNRVEKGGHSVDKQKVEDRYYRTLNLLISAIEASDKSYLFDNSSEQLNLIAKIIDGKLELTVTPEKLPNWFLEYVLKYYDI